MPNPVILNEDQSKAISHGDGPALVIAGPGSGKTLVITHRIQNLIKEHKVRPENILVITFTKAAAIEMQYRFYALAGNYPVNFGTCHAIFFQIIRDATTLNGSNIIKESEKRELMEEILSNPEKDESFILDANIETIQKMISEISKVKNFGKTAEEYECIYCSKEEFNYIYKSYEEACLKENKIDFDDMLARCLTLLKSNQNLLNKYQSIFKYILVDEFQDVNPVQYEIIKLLAKPDNNIFVVGDDDQSIYGFRGATPNIMQKFLEDYKEADKIELLENFRSKKDIVDTSVRLINNNENRFIKKCVSKNKGGNAVRYFTYETRPEQYAAVAKSIEQYMKLENKSYNDIAILYRTNGHTAMLIPELKKLGIPFKSKEKLSNIYETEIGKDIYAYISFALDDKNVKAFFRIMNRPSRYIKRKQVPVNNFSREELFKLQDNPDVIHRITQLYNQLEFLKGLEPYPAINFIRKGMGYDAFMKNDEDALEILDEITEAAKTFNSLKKWKDFVSEYDGTLKESYNLKTGVSIMTMHASKGLEYPFVILPDLNEGMVPHKKARTLEQIEEERRIFYVAMTRAKDYLFLFFVKAKKADLVSPPSRFLTECNDYLNSQDS